MHRVAELLAAVEQGAPELFTEHYDPEIELDLHLAGDRRTITGRAEATEALGGLLDGPSTLVDSLDGPFGLAVESAIGDRPPIRRHHLVWTAGDLPNGPIVAHTVLDALATTGHPLGPAVPGVLQRATDRGPLIHRGLAGARLERAMLADGSAVVVKRIDPAWDWIMRATADRGREAMVHTEGVLDDLPAPLRSAVRAAEPVGGGWALVLDDLSDRLVTTRRPPVLDDAETARLIDGMVGLHERHDGADLSALGLCTLADRIRLAGTATQRREADGRDLFPKLFAFGWERLADLVPGRIAEALATVHDRADRIAEDLLARGGTTLLHGDLNERNLAMDPDGGLVVFDWGLATLGPPEIDLAWMVHVGRLWPVDSDRLITLWSERAGPRDPRMLALALATQFAASAPQIAAVACHPDPLIRAAGQDRLAWWIETTEPTLIALAET